jgi:hypothetical protein
MNMHKLFRTLLMSLAVTAPMAQAAVINFDQPALIDIDNATGNAVYREAGFALSGDAAGFLQLDGIGTNASGGLFLTAGSTLSIMAGDDGLFSFLGLDAGSLDATVPAMLDIVGVFADKSQQNLMLSLSGLGPVSIAAWNGLAELRFMASADVVLDNINLSAVPEPGSIAMVMLGLGALFGARRVRKGRAPALRA